MDRAARAALGALAVAVFSLLAAAPAEAGELGWRRLQAAVEYVEVSGKESGLEGDERIHVVRVDPGRVSLVAVMASEGDRKARTAGEWCRARG